MLFRSRAALKDHMKVYRLIVNTVHECVIGGDRKAVEHFMRDYYLHADALRHFTDRLMEEALAEVSGRSKKVDLGDGLYLADGKINAFDPDETVGNDGAFLKIFQKAALHNARLSPTLLHAIHSNTPTSGSGTAAPQSEGAKWFWQLFSAKGEIHGILEDMHDAGALECMEKSASCPMQSPIMKFRSVLYLLQNSACAIGLQIASKFPGRILSFSGMPAFVLSNEPVLQQALKTSKP